VQPRAGHKRFVRKSRGGRGRVAAKGSPEFNIGPDLTGAGGRYSLRATTQSKPGIPPSTRRHQAARFGSLPPLILGGARHC